MALLAGLALATTARAADLPVQTVDGFQKGHTTKAQVQAALGRATVPGPSSELSYVYDGPAAAGVTPGHKVMLWLLFDRDGVLLDIQLYEQKGPSLPLPPSHPREPRV
jgi:hypothetical protein